MDSTPFPDFPQSDFGPLGSLSDQQWDDMMTGLEESSPEEDWLALYLEDAEPQQEQPCAACPDRPNEKLCSICQIKRFGKVVDAESAAAGAANQDEASPPSPQPFDHIEGGPALALPAADEEAGGVEQPSADEETGGAEQPSQDGGSTVPAIPGDDDGAESLSLEDDVDLFGPDPETSPVPETPKYPVLTLPPIAPPALTLPEPQNTDQGRVSVQQASEPAHQPAYTPEPEPAHQPAPVPAPARTIDNLQEDAPMTNDREENCPDAEPPAASRRRTKSDGSPRVSSRRAEKLRHRSHPSPGMSSEGFVAPRRSLSRALGPRARRETPPQHPLARSVGRADRAVVPAGDDFGLAAALAPVLGPSAGLDQGSASAPIVVPDEQEGPAPGPAQVSGQYAVNDLSQFYGHGSGFGPAAGFGQENEFPTSEVGFSPGMPVAPMDYGNQGMVAGTGVGGGSLVSVWPVGSQLGQMAPPQTSGGMAGQMVPDPAAGYAPYHGFTPQPVATIYTGSPNPGAVSPYVPPQTGPMPFAAGENNFSPNPNFALGNAGGSPQGALTPIPPPLANRYPANGNLQGAASPNTALTYGYPANAGSNASLGRAATPIGYYPLPQFAPANARPPQGGHPVPGYIHPADLAPARFGHHHRHPVRIDEACDANGNLTYWYEGYPVIGPRETWPRTLMHIDQHIARVAARIQAQQQGGPRRLGPGPGPAPAFAPQQQVGGGPQQGMMPSGGVAPQGGGMMQQQNLPGQQGWQ